MWRVKYADACTYQVLNMHWRLASDICTSIVQFGARGQGRVQWMNRRFVRIRISGAIAYAYLDEREHTLWVVRIVAIR